MRDVPLRVTPSVKPADSTRSSIDGATSRPIGSSVSAASISADTKDALARDVPEAEHCRTALRAGLALYGANARSTHFITHRNTVARLFWSLLDERKAHPIEQRAATRLRRLPTFAIELPGRAANGAEQARTEVRPLDRDARRFSRLRFGRRRHARIPSRIRPSRGRDGRPSCLDAAQHRPYREDDDAKESAASSTIKTSTRSWTCSP